MTVEATNPKKTTEPTLEEEIVTRNLVDCPHCGSPAILFSCTIQTFCYRCARPVTELDESNLYYQPVAASPQPE